MTIIFNSIKASNIKINVTIQHILLLSRLSANITRKTREREREGWWWGWGIELQRKLKTLLPNLEAAGKFLVVLFF
uniref:Uncharacterized protein n=1 Tax=Salix viminalis TaxID=40686 RepID=A0A6N2LX66_SALVM